MHTGLAETVYPIAQTEQAQFHSVNKIESNSDFFLKQASKVNNRYLCKWLSSQGKHFPILANNVEFDPWK